MTLGYSLLDLLPLGLPLGLQILDQSRIRVSVGVSVGIRHLLLLWFITATFVQLLTNFDIFKTERAIIIIII